MPWAPRRPCQYVGCAEFSEPGSSRCKAHRPVAKRRIDAVRGNSAERGYDRQWRALRITFLAQHPVCECDECQAGKVRLRAATVVDHIQTIRDRPDLRLDWSNLRAMNKQCHDRHTAKTQGFASDKKCHYVTQSGRS